MLTCGGFQLFHDQWHQEAAALGGRWACNLGLLRADAQEVLLGGGVGGPLLPTAACPRGVAGRETFDTACEDEHEVGPGKGQNTSRGIIA